MTIPFLQRLRAACGIIVRGSIAPFDRIGSIGSVAADGRLSEPYRESLWVHAAVRHIARPIAAVSLDHSQRSAAPARNDRRSSAADAPLEDPRLDDFWNRPARRLESFEEFLIASVGWRKLAGECFWLMDDSSTVPFPEVRMAFPQMILAEPDRMQHVLDGGQIVGWRYTDLGGRSHLLLPDQVIHLKQWNPYNPYRGLGNYEAARIPAEADRASAAFVRNLSLSNGDQGVYVVAKNGVLDDAQRAQIVAQLRDKQDFQRRGIFRPAFLTGDIEVQDPKIRAVDAPFLDARRMSAAEIFIAFGVPPSMAKEAPSYSIGSASDYYRLILDTCIPEAREIAAGIARVSSRLMGRPVEAEFCWDEHPVMQEVRKERMQAAEQLWTKGMPMATVSEYLDLDLPRYPGDDIGWLPISVVPASAAGDPMPTASAANEPVDDSTTPTPGSDPVAMALRCLRQRAESPVSAADRRLWATQMRRRAKSVRAYQSAFGRVLHEARKEVLRKIEARASRTPQDDSGGVMAGVRDSGASQPAAARGGGQFSEAISTRAGAIDLLFDLVDFTKGLIAAFRRVATSVLQDAGQDVFTELGKDDPFVYPPERALQFMAARENRLTDVSQGVFDEIKAALQEGMNAGDGMPQLAARVRAAFNACSAGRAQRIAMTETAAAYGVARHDAMVQAGVRHKRWVTSGADNVRPAHREAHNQTVRVAEAFDVGGEQLMHPGDPAGSAANVINCHCVAVAVDDPDQDLTP